MSDSTKEESLRKQLEEANLTNKLLLKLQMPIVLLCLSLIGWFLTVRISSYFNWPPPIYSDSEVFNLTKEKVSWDVFYGHSTKCGDLPCHLTDDYPSENYTKKMILPAREFPLKDYKPGQKIYLRSKIRLPDNPSWENTSLTFHSTYIFAKKYQVYINSRLVEEGESELLNITIPSDLINPNRQLSLAIVVDPGDLPYQGLAHRGDLVIGPKIKLIETTFLARDLTTNVHLWFLLPKITLTVMFIFIFVFIARTLDTFAFIIYAFISALEIFLRSGFASMMIPWIGDAGEFIGMNLRNFAFAFLFLFVTNFFRLHSKIYKNIFFTTIVVLSFISIASNTILPFKTAYNLIDLIIVFVRPSVIGFACYGAFKTYQHSRHSDSPTPRKRFSLILLIFFSAYLLFLVGESTSIILDMFGLNAAQPVVVSKAFDLTFFFVLAAITVLEIGYEISAKQRIESELKAIEARIELGKSVQELLLPPVMSGSFSQYQFDFFYEPAQKMSGDWINIWTTSHGEHRLFIGDVVGKGPQAALAVAAISSVIEECKSRSFSMPETLDTIHRRLRELFSGKVSTTLAVASLLKDNEIELYNCGSIGWVHSSPEKTIYLPARGTGLGVSQTFNVGSTRIHMQKGDRLFTFTDGCLEGSRPLKRLVKAVDEAGAMNAERIKNLIIDIGKDDVYKDDKTVLVISHSSNEDSPTYHQSPLVS